MGTFANSSSKLIEWCGTTFSNAVFAVYEQIRPNDGFGRVMQQHFIQLSIPLLSLPAYPDKETQQNRYLHKVVMTHFLLRMKDIFCFQCTGLDFL